MSRRDAIRRGAWSAMLALRGALVGVCVYLAVSSGSGAVAVMAVGLAILCGLEMMLRWPVERALREWEDEEDT